MATIPPNSKELGIFVANLMKFKFRDLGDKNRKSRYLLGIYTLGKTNKNNNKINSKFLHILAIFFIGLFILAMLSSVLLLGSLIYYKFTVKEETIITKSSNPAMLVPSFTKDTLQEIQDEQQKLMEGGMNVEDIQKRYFVFIPFYFYIPIIFITMAIHEFGHYLMCRRAGIKVKEYGVGALSLFCIPILPVAYVDPAKKHLKQANKLSFFSMISAGVSLNLLISIISLAISIIFNMRFFNLLFLINFSIAICNVLPLGFFDGGKFISKISPKLNYVTSFLSLMLLFLLFI